MSQIGQTLEQIHAENEAAMAKNQADRAKADADFKAHMAKVQADVRRTTWYVAIGITLVVIAISAGYAWLQWRHLSCSNPSPIRLDSGEKCSAPRSFLVQEGVALCVCPRGKP